MTTLRLRAAGLALAAVLVHTGLPAPAGAASRYDPRLRFQSITTEHFVIYFHQGEAHLAQRLAAIAEDTQDTLGQRLTSSAGKRTHVILVNQDDLSNGWATPFPYNMIEIAVIPPPADSIIGNTDDWLRLVFAHEYTHILHLDQSRGWASVVRRLFGRNPLAFPNLYLPQWQTEGIATYFESAVTHQGRVATGEFGKLFDAEVRGDSRPIDRANGGLAGWPGGNAGYIYGAFFHDYLARRYGEARLQELTRRTAGAVPYTSDGVYGSIYGRRLSDLWNDFQIELTATPKAEPFPPSARRLTHHGFAVLGPRWDPSVSARVFYSVRNPHGFPSILALTIDRGEPETIVRRYLGDRLAVTRDALYFDQLDFVRSIALQSDLYRFTRFTTNTDDRAGVHRRGLVRLTRDARALEPDVSPDGRMLAYLLVVPGGRSLATVSLGANGLAAAGPTVLLTESDGELSAPRWSPDGRQIAVERRRLNQGSELILVDATSGETRVLVATDTARSVTPAWLPDGRTILFASDRDGQPFNLFAVDIATGAQYRVTDLPGGASSPDISPDGTSVVYVGYTADGQDLFTIPLDRSSWRSLEDSGPAVYPVLNQKIFRGGTAPAADPGSADGTPSQPAPLTSAAAPQEYSPWQTLAPRFWSPIFEYDDEGLRAGGTTSGGDVLGRHYYAGSVLWGADAGRPDWSASYVYDRWRPSILVTASGEAIHTTEGILRDEQFNAGLTYPFRRVRYTQQLFAGVRQERGIVGCGPVDDDCNLSSLRQSARNSFRFGWQLNTSRSYGYSVSAQDGITATVTSEHVRPGIGADGSADAVTGDFRAFLTAGGRHAVLAARLAAGTSRGDADVRRTFTLGGNGPELPTFDFGRDALALLRGFHPRDINGPHAALLNVDYRVPLVRIERGRGLMPFFVRWMHGSAFVDAGHAWEGSFSWRDLKTSVGAELSVDSVIAYAVPMTVTVGSAWRRDGASQLPGGTTFYVRVGRAF